MKDFNEKDIVTHDNGAKTLDDIMSEYTAPFVDSAPPTNTEQFPWSSAPGTQQTGNKPANGFNITHDPAGSDPEVRLYKSGPKAGQPRPPRKGQPVSKPTNLQASAFLTGALLLSFLDMLLPLALAGLNNWRSKIKIKADDLMMTSKQKEELKPMADAVLRELNVQASPTVLLCIGMVGIYAGNVMMLRSESEMKMKLEHEKNKGMADKAPSPNDVRRVPNTHY